MIVMMMMMMMMTTMMMMMMIMMLSNSVHKAGLVVARRLVANVKTPALKICAIGRTGDLLAHDEHTYLMTLSGIHLMTSSVAVALKQAMQSSMRMEITKERGLKCAVQINIENAFVIRCIIGRIFMVHERYFGC